MVSDWKKVAVEKAKSGHSLLSSSTMPRVMRCKGSLRACVMADLAPKDSEWSIDGHRAHHLAQVVFEARLTNTEARASDYAGVWVGEELDQFKPTEEMIDAVQLYVDWCQELPGDHYFELRLPFGERKPLPDQFGSSDHVAVYGHVLCVTDFKYGKGVQVYAEDNEQLLDYALGAHDQLSWAYPIEEIVIRVAQPRRGHMDVWTTTVERLMQFAEAMYEACEDALSETAAVRPGIKQCFFCPVGGRCSGQYEAVQAALNNDFDSFDTDRPIRILTPAEVEKALDAKDLVKKWLTQVDRAAMQMVLQDPASIPSKKIVESKTNRAWVSEHKAEVWLQRRGLREAQIVKRKLVTPAQAEALLPKDARAEFREINEDDKRRLVFKPRGRPVLASIADRRPLFAGVTADEFDEFDDELLESEDES